jgi:hypothetical protein
MSKKKKSKKPYTNYTPAIIALSTGLLVFVLALIFGNGGPSQPNGFNDETTSSPPMTLPPISLPFIDESDPSSTTIESEDLTDDETNVQSDTIVIETMTDESTPPETVTQTTAPVLSPAVSWDDSQTVSDSYTYEGETLYFKTVTYPVLTNGFPNAVDKINEELEKFAKDFILISSNDKLLARESYESARFDFEAYENTASFTVFVHNNAISIRFNVYRNSGGASSDYTTTAFTFDLLTGDLMNFAEYIGKTDEFGRNYILTVFRQLISRAPADYYDDANEILTSALSSKSILYQYYLTENGVVLYFDAGTLSPKAHGTDSYTISFRDLNK